MQSAVTLVLRVSSGSKKGHFKAVFAPNGRLKPQFGIVDGVATELPTSSYYLRYRVNGRRVWESVGPDPTNALRQHKQREHQVRGLALGVEAVPGTRLHAAATRPSKDEEAQESPAVQLGCLIREYSKKTEMRTGNKRTGDQYFRDLTEAREAIGPKLPAEITREDVQIFIHKLLDRGMKPKTIHNRLTTLRAFLRHHGQDGKAVNKADAPKSHKKIPATYSHAQIRVLLAASDAEDRLIWELFLCAGLRERELSYLSWEDILLERGMIHLHAKPDLGFYLKDREERQIPLPTSMMRSLLKRRMINPTDRLVFPTPKGKPDGHLLRRLKAIAYAANLNCGLCVNRAGESCASKAVCSKWQLHSFRRTAANRWHEAGLTVPSVQRLLGHSDVDTTMHYLTGQDLARPEYRDVMDKCYSVLQQAA